MKKETVYVALCNQKGGVGKSAMTILLAGYYHYLMPNLESHDITNSLIDAAQAVMLPYAEGISLREACVKLGFLTPEKFDEVFHPEEMV